MGKQYNIGDIVFVSNVENEQEVGTKYHFFVIIDEDQTIVSADLFGFLISSNNKKEKSKSKFKYNEPLLKSKTNGLFVDSHVKCDKLYNFKPYCVINKIGEVDISDYLRFIEAYKKYLEENEIQTVVA